MLMVSEPPDSCHVPDHVEVQPHTPQSALRRTSSDWDGAAARLIKRLHAFASGRRDSLSSSDAFAVVHLCGEKGDVRAHAIVCRLIANDDGIADWLGDAVTETLPGILIKTFDGHAARLRAAVVSPVGDPFARASALAALGYLVRARGAMTDAAMRAFLRRVRRDVLPRRESILWMTWATVAANLGYESLRPEVATLQRAGFIPGGDFGVEDFDARIGLTRSDASGLAGFAADLIAPLDDAQSALRWTDSRTAS
ncbi:uncharacterized protein DUF1186 [Roseiarcus fermentans]|uniref:Uncharacterized protein DUF1186 n=1 Tax=Roseiarcus fermentans TaxID=1473586 RepID=A0A366F7N2_9HYPH|nr:DUF1186 domain-containing protein [Roseiarcus fermentans]RBP09769.1 uncharacterized protein DUF1186 [Roseiarcus fermentans]